MSQPTDPGAGGPAAPAPKMSVVTYKAELRKAIRRNAHEPEVNFLNITANPGVEFQTVVAVMDALRTTPNGDNLFENIQFGVPR